MQSLNESPGHSIESPGHSIEPSADAAGTIPPPRGKSPRAPAAKGSRESVTWQGRKIPIVKTHGGLWRLRGRTKGAEIDVGLGVKTLPDARRRAKEILESSGFKPRQRSSTHTLEDLVNVYKSLPKRVSARTVVTNLSRLRSVVKKTLGKTLEEVPLSKIGPAFWEEYQRAMLGKNFDYATRRLENISINSACRSARAIFINRLRPQYERAGIYIPRDADVMIMLPEPVLVRAEADETALLPAWVALEATDPAMWLAVGLARFAGLRRDEIAACRGEWIVSRGDAVYIELRDRPEHGFWTKTGKVYRAPVIHPALAAALLKVQKTALVVNPSGERRRVEWFKEVPQEWLRPFTGSARKPLHRLRGLYADAVRELTESAVRIKLEATKAASAALGHTSTEMTEKHYFSDKF